MLGLLLLPLAAAVTSLAAAPEAANAATTANTSICHDASYGGNWYCGYGRHSYTLSNGTNQFFVIGTDFAVWTRWRTSSGVYSNWVSLGGQIRRSYSAADFSLEACKSNPIVHVVGTDNRWYTDARKTNGAWTGWFQGLVVAC